MSLVRYRFVLLLAAGGWLAACHASGEQLAAASDLRDDARRVAAQRVPLVVFFRSRDCRYCREVEELYLEPRQRDPDARPRILLRVVDVDGRQPLVGFDGARIDHAGFARQQGVQLVPHLRFLGPGGEPLTPDLIGFSSPDFYGGYLDGAIQAAHERLQR